MGERGGGGGEGDFTPHGLNTPDMRCDIPREPADAYTCTHNDNLLSEVQHTRGKTWHLDSLIAPRQVQVREPDRLKFLNEGSVLVLSVLRPS